MVFWMMICHYLFTFSLVICSATESNITLFCRQQTCSLPLFLICSLHLTEIWFIAQYMPSFRFFGSAHPQKRAYKHFCMLFMCLGVCISVCVVLFFCLYKVKHLFASPIHSEQITCYILIYQRTYTQWKIKHFSPHILVLFFSIFYLPSSQINIFIRLNCSAESTDTWGKFFLQHRRHVVSVFIMS